MSKILSGKGGVGKSSITTQLALSLSLSGHSVGILDIDLTGPSIPRLLGIESSKVTQAPGGWLPVKVHNSQTLTPVPPPTYPLEPQPAIDANPSPDTSAASTTSASNGATRNLTTASATSPIGSLHCMSLAFLLASRSTAIVWRGPKKTAMVRQFLSDVLWPPIDYLLIDTPPGTSDEHISVVETLLKLVSDSTSSKPYPNLAGAVIVTTPQAVAISDVRKEINFCVKTGVKILGVVENMSGYVCPCCGVPANIFSKGGGEVMATEFGVPFLGSVPLDGLWGQLVEEGIRPVYGEPVTGASGDQEAEDGSMEAEGRNGAEGNHGSEAEGEGGNESRVAQQRRREEGLLVDKYRSCSLYPVFMGISQKLVKMVEGGQANNTVLVTTT